MSVGPLRRATAAIGLVALLPIALMLVAGAITPEEAATRALVVAFVVVLVGNAARRVLLRLLRRVERRASSDGSEDTAAPVADGASRRA